MKIDGLSKMKKTFDKLSKTYGDKSTVVVGFTAAYAVYVHENTEARHTNGVSKFLETPARQLGPKLSILIKNVIGKSIASGRKVSLVQALVLAGFQLQAAAQKLTPVDTGNLKGSARTYKEK